MYYKSHELIKLKIPASVVGQIQCVVNHFDTEVSWYGDVTQEDDTTFFIKNIYLFPQVVTSGTFRTDTPQVSELYDSWYDGKLTEMSEEYDRTGVVVPIMQYNGHSHVNAACSPSLEDMKFRKSREGLNIYSIHNKSGKMTWEIWTDDMVYEPEDIDVIYIDDVFLHSKEYVLKPTPVPAIGSGWSRYGTRSTYTPPATTAITPPPKGVSTEVMEQLPPAIQSIVKKKEAGTYVTKAEEDQLSMYKKKLRAVRQETNANQLYYQREMDMLTDDELAQLLLEESYQEALAQGLMV